MPDPLVERLPCGCPDMDDWEWLDPCPGHVWTHWHGHSTDALTEFRLCFYCGTMETQTVALDSDA